MIINSVLNRIPRLWSSGMVIKVKPINFSLSEKWFHVIFWLGFYLYNSLVESSFLDDYPHGFYANFVRLPLQIALVYFNIYYLLPKYLLNKKYSLYFLSLIVLLALVVIVKRLLIYGIVYPATCPVTYQKEALITFSNFFLLLNSEVYLIGLTTAMKMAMDWSRNIKTTKALEKEKFEAELGLLRAQIQPHFFFNTLNNLYALTLKKSDQAPGIVQKLSELMSYLLYDCDRDVVPLQEEVQLIHNYLDLEKLRYGKRLQVKFDMKGCFTNQWIPPYIILPFVENAFKHSQKDVLGVTIYIFLKADDNQLTLRIKNPISRDKKLVKGGIGLKNVQRRLGLLYGTDYSLEVHSENNEYQVTLLIPFNKKPVEIKN